MENDLEHATRDLGFRIWHPVRDRASVADIFREPSRCGIYVLSFANGEGLCGSGS